MKALIQKILNHLHFSKQTTPAKEFFPGQDVVTYTELPKGDGFVATHEGTVITGIQSTAEEVHKSDLQHVRGNAIPYCSPETLRGVTGEAIPYSAAETLQGSIDSPEFVFKNDHDTDKLKQIEEQMRGNMKLVTGDVDKLRGDTSKLLNLDSVTGTIKLPDLEAENKETEKQMHGILPDDK